MSEPVGKTHGTRIIQHKNNLTTLVMQRAGLVVEKGPDTNKTYPIDRLLLRVGTDPTNDIVLTDETISKHHFELSFSEDGPILRDLGSTNGTVVDGSRVGLIYLKKNSYIQAGQTTLRFVISDEDVEIELSRRTNFGRLLGHSPPMQAAFATLEKAAKTDSTVLILGESGTGKELAAQGLHEHSARKTGEFLIFDCGAASPSLIESQLFGHARGAFTGATDAKAGVVEAAQGGTLVLDEIGELPIELQPKLLRVLENRTIRRLGETRDRSIDVRFVACTNRNLNQEVEAGRFRQDLLYRLSVISVRLPPLRERPEEIPRLIRHFVNLLGGDSGAELPEPLLKLLLDHRWPGNVRELKNFVERYLAFPSSAPEQLLGISATADESGDSENRPSIVADLPFHEAKQHWNDHFEKHYLMLLLERHKGNISAVAREAELSRQTCYRLMLKHELRSD